MNKNQHMDLKGFPREVREDILKWVRRYNRHVPGHILRYWSDIAASQGPEEVTAEWNAWKNIYKKERGLKR